MKRFVVLTTEWLPWLHGLYWYQRLLCKQPERESRIHQLVTPTVHFCQDLHYTLPSTYFSLSGPVVKSSTELRRVEVATVMGEEDHAFQYVPGENKSTVWPGR